MSVTLKLSVVLGAIVVLSLAVGHNIWASLFSDSQTIIKEFAAMTPLLAVSILFDSAQGVLSGKDITYKETAYVLQLLSFSHFGV